VNPIAGIISICFLFSLTFYLEAEPNQVEKLGLFSVLVDQTSNLHIDVWQEGTGVSNRFLQNDGTAPLQNVLLLGDDVVLLDNTMASTDTDSKYPSWKYHDLSMELRVITSGSLLSYAIIASNLSKTVQTVSFRLILDIADSPNPSDIYIEDKKIVSETLFKTINYTPIRLETTDHASVMDLVLGPSKLGAILPDHLVVSNIQRLVSSGKDIEIMEGRNFSYLPFSVNDRGMACMFPVQTILPGTTTIFILPIGNAVFNEKDFEQAITATMPKLKPNFSVLNKKADSDLDEINQLLKNINQNLDQPNTRLEDWERTIDQIERIRSRSGS